MANPVIARLHSLDHDSSTQPMTLNGTVIRTSLLLAVCASAGLLGYFLIPSGVALLPLLVSAAAAVGIAIWAARHPLKAKWPAFAYACFQGVLVGSFTHLYTANGSASQMMLQALLLTAATVAATLVAYVTGVIKVTFRFRSIVLIATTGVLAYYLLALVMALFGVDVPLIYDSGPWGIAFSLLVIVIAASNLFLDYSLVEQAISDHVDERFEWYAAFGLTVTILWIYMEMLRLLSRIR